MLLNNKKLCTSINRALGSSSCLIIMVILMTTLKSPGMTNNLMGERSKKGSCHHCDHGTNTSYRGHLRGLIIPLKVML